MRTLPITGTIALLLFSTILAGPGCGSSGNQTDGDDVTDGDAADGDAADGDTDQTQSRCTGTVNPATIVAAEGGVAQVCDPSDPLDGARMRILSKKLAGDATVTISGASDLTVPGYRPVGPAVTFATSGPSIKAKNYVELFLPFARGTIGSDNLHASHLHIAYQAAGESIIRFIPRNQYFTRVDAALASISGDTTFFGTYQVVAPDREIVLGSRRFTYWANSGISMGGGGAAYVGINNPDRFDILGLMGGPFDLTYILHMINRQHLKGFCTLAEIEADPSILTDPTHECGECVMRYNPDDMENPERVCYVVSGNDPDGLEHPNGYNKWYYDNNGGNFDRDEYLDIFQDLTLAFGNFMTWNPASPYLAAGVPLSFMELSDAQKCDPVFLRTTGWWPIRNFYDGAYNPNGSYDVITYCEGANRTGDYSPEATHDHPMDIGTAVDINGNGIRDFGEPVISQPWEPYDDVGSDGLPDAQEAGYDPVSNPDPAGDNYHYFDNPRGTEQNWRWDQGEPYEDVGIDGVAGTPQHDNGGYDYGEGNNRFDYSPNVQNLLDNCPRTGIDMLETSAVSRLNIYLDGGIRDIFNFAVMLNTVAGSIRGHGEDIRIYNDFPTVMDPDVASNNEFSFMRVDYSRLGKHVAVRYGDPNASAAAIANGDGRHVGMAQQVVYRLQTFYGFVNHIFPNGDWEPVPVGQWNPEAILIADEMYSEVLGMYRPYSIVLPPGYDQAAGQRRYPAVLLKHGYGMTPEDMASGLTIMLGYMAEGSMQKIITVFPDGKCWRAGRCEEVCRWRCDAKTPGDAGCKGRCPTECAEDVVKRECVQGNFYANHQATLYHPGTYEPGEFREGQVEDHVLELMDFVDQNYNTKPAADVTVDMATMEAVY